MLAPMAKTFITRNPNRRTSPVAWPRMRNSISATFSAVMAIESIELAATENAKVCASVRIKYFAVESTSPEERLRPEPGRDAGDADLSRPGMGGVGMSRFNPSRVGDLEAPDNSRRIRGLPEGI